MRATAVSISSVMLCVLRDLVVAQGTMTATFDGPPQISPGSGVLVQSYYESGIAFTTISSGSLGFVLQFWTNSDGYFPYNGTVYLQAGVGSSLMFRSYGSDTLFGIAQVDLAGYSYLAPGFSVDFIGYRPDGSVITTNFAGTGLSFQTFYFGPDWSTGLQRVEVPSEPWSMDNLAFATAEPSSGALLFVSAFLYSWVRSSRQPNKPLMTNRRSQIPPAAGCATRRAVYASTLLPAAVAYLCR